MEYVVICGWYSLSTVWVQSEYSLSTVQVQDSESVKYRLFTESPLEIPQNRNFGLSEKMRTFIQVTPN